MTAPTAENLFWSVWSEAMNSEESTQPGSHSWQSSRAAQLRYWAGVWADCVELSAHISECSDLGQKAISVIEAEKRAPATWPAET